MPRRQARRRSGAGRRTRCSRGCAARRPGRRCPRRAGHRGRRRTGPRSMRAVEQGGRGHRDSARERSIPAIDRRDRGRSRRTVRIWRSSLPSSTASACGRAAVDRSRGRIGGPPRGTPRRPARSTHAAPRPADPAPSRAVEQPALRRACGASRPDGRRRLPSGVAHVGDPEVDIGRQPAVQFHLPMADACFAHLGASRSPGSRASPAS